MHTLGWYVLFHANMRVNHPPMKGLTSVNLTNVNLTRVLPNFFPGDRIFRSINSFYRIEIADGAFLPLRAVIMSMTSSLHSALRATCTAAQSRCHIRCPTSHIRPSSSFAAFTFVGIRFQRYFALHLRRRSFIQTDRSIRKKKTGVSRSAASDAPNENKIGRE